MRFAACCLLIACSAGEAEVTPEPTPEPATFDANGIPEQDPEGTRITRLDPVDVDGFTDPILFTVGADTVSFFPTVRAEGEHRVALTYAESPSGEVWVDIDTPTVAEEAIVRTLTGGLPGLYSSPNRVIPNWRRSASMLPNTPELEIEAGEWILEFGVFDDDGPVEDTLHLSISEKTGPTQGVLELDLHLNFTGANGFDASTAAENPRVQALVDQIETAFSEADIVLGTLTYEDLPGSDTMADLTPGSCLPSSDTLAMLESIEEAPTGALNLVFIDTFTCGDNPLAIAIAGLSPGIPGVPQSTRDGVFINTGILDLPVPDLEDIWSRVGAHEIGHFFGLYHTSELVGNGALNDPLLDTPMGNDSVTNLMFPDAMFVSDITDDQRFVLERSLYLHPPFDQE